MGEIRRGLLTQGNQKLGESIHIWSIPAIETCPGATKLCKSVCYSTRGRFRFDVVRERMTWNWEQASHDDFVDRMVREIKAKGCLVIRVHSSGDFADEVYARKWLQIMKKAPKPKYYWYSRSWRIPAILPVLEEMAALKCCRAWYSIDAETGMPERVAPGVRLAYLQMREDEAPENSHLIFRIRKLRRLQPRIGLRVLPVCPNEVKTDGKESDEVTCGSCMKCFR